MMHLWKEKKHNNKEHKRFHHIFKSAHLKLFLHHYQSPQSPLMVPNTLSKKQKQNLKSCIFVKKNHKLEQGKVFFIYKCLLVMAHQ